MASVDAIQWGHETPIYQYETYTQSVSLNPGEIGLGTGGLTLNSLNNAVLSWNVDGHQVTLDDIFESAKPKPITNFSKWLEAKYNK